MAENEIKDLKGYAHDPGASAALVTTSTNLIEDLIIEIVDEAPGMLVIGLQPSGNDDAEAFRPEWPS